MGLAQGGLEGRNIAHILNMEIVAEEEFLKFRATGNLVQSIEVAVGVGVNCQEEARRAFLGVLEEFLKLGGVHPEGYVQVNASQNNVTGPTIEDDSGAVTVAKMGDWLGLQEPGRVNCSTWVWLR